MFSEEERRQIERDFFAKESAEARIALAMGSDTPFADAAKGVETMLKLRGLVKDYDGTAYVTKSLVGKDRRGQCGGVSNVGLGNPGTVHFKKKVQKGRAKAKAARKARKKQRRK